MNNGKKALIWVTDTLKKHHVPFQITGGLAAIAYGANRPLEDIDIDIPDNQFEKIMDDVKSYIIFGPKRFKNDKWDLMLMTLNYQGQDIDLSGADSTRIYDEKAHEWILLNEDLLKATQKNIFDLDLPVIPLINLVYYKKILAREVDLIDIQQVENKNEITGK